MALQTVPPTTMGMVSIEQLMSVHSASRPSNRGWATRSADPKPTFLACEHIAMLQFYAMRIEN
jgi:hypothetical protein